MKLPSVLLTTSGIIVFFGIQIAEANYTGEYSTARNYISDLGVNSTSALIFNLAMSIAGLLIIISAFKLKQNKYSKLLWISLLLYGIGTAGVGIFPGDISPLHGIFAGVLFLTGPIAAISSKKYTTKAIGNLCVVLAGTSIVFLISFAIEQNYYNVGIIERLVVYPITIWLIVFGSHISKVEIQKS